MHENDTDEKYLQQKFSLTVFLRETTTDFTLRLAKITLFYM